jgi:hypothetical protein
MLRRERLRHGKQQQFGEHHELAVPAGIVIGVADRLHAVGIEGERHRHDPLSGGQRALRLRSVVQDLGAELVPHDDVALGIQRERHARFTRRVDHLRRMLPRVKIGAADAARECTDEDFSRSRRGIREGIHDELSLPHHDGAHATSTAVA